VFTGDVIIINPEYTITSNTLTYLRNTEDSFAKGNVIVTTDSAIIKAENIDFFKRQGKTFAFENVRIESDSTIITSDTLTNYSNENKSIASGNVKINDLRNTTTVYGNYLENYEDRNYSFIQGNSKLIQIEEDSDTLFLYSYKMEAFRNEPEYYVATDSVEVIRGEFLSKCGIAKYKTSSNESEESISLSLDPIVWQENMQLTGDSIYAELVDRKLKTIFVKKLQSIQNSKISFLIIQNDNEYFQDRYDQVSGIDITMHFKDDEIKKVDVSKSSKSISFLFEDKKANGLNIAEGENMFIYFDDEQKVSKIRIDEEPVGQYVPENLTNNVSHTLPGFNLRNDKPIRR
jgi:lipopolysaccharide export system protein LptA